VIRTIRVLRVFRIFKLGRYVREGEALMQAMRASRWRITVFFGAVLMICVVVGALMYVVEGAVPRAPGEGFTSIPRSIYWAIVTLTTVGYGDISPTTAIGQTIAAFVMILGYAIIAVPTGIVTAELAKHGRKARDGQHEVSTAACMSCSQEGHDPDADFCKYCGAAL
ncbi:MAG TPA: ion transporter, partial [Bacteroidetes bacterium]|nr:ion transporter [Bacteroidota bacterium]